MTPIMLEEFWSVVAYKILNKSSHYGWKNFQICNFHISFC